MSTHDWEELSIKPITPMLLGGPVVDGRIQCRPRTQLIPSLRGELRWWWRAIVGPLVGSDLGLLHQLESQMFGRAVEGEDGFQSPIRLRLLSTPECETVPSGSLPEFADNRWVKYLLGQGVVERVTTEEPRYWNFRRDGYIVAGNTFKVRVQFRPPSDDSTALPVEIARSLFGYLLWFVSQFGGLGARSRRGFGAINITWKRGIVPPWSSAEGVLAEVHKVIVDAGLASPASSAKSSSRSPFPMFRDGHYYTGSRPIYEKPLAELARLGESWRRHRATREVDDSKCRLGLKTPEWLDTVSKANPRRPPTEPFGLGALGMPVQFKKEIGVNVVADDGSPLRLASPVRFRPAMSPGGLILNAVGFATEPHPPCGKLMISNGNVQTPVSLPYEVVVERVQSAVKALTSD